MTDSSVEPEVEETPEVEVEQEEPVNHVSDVVDNMYAGELDAMRTSFNNAMADKVADALVDRRLELAATMFQPAVEESVKEEKEESIEDAVKKQNAQYEKTRAAAKKSNEARPSAHVGMRSTNPKGPGSSPVYKK